MNIQKVYAEKIQFYQGERGIKQLTIRYTKTFLTQDDNNPSTTYLQLI